MVTQVEKGIFWENPNAQIIFNPVSTSKSKAGRNLFNHRLRDEYGEVFEEYKDYMIGESQKRLLGDIQLVQIGEDKFIMNAFIYHGTKLSLKAVAKTMVEMFNIATEYHLNVAMSETLGIRTQTNVDSIKLITDVVFGDFENTCYLYKLSPHVKHKAGRKKKNYK